MNNIDRAYPLSINGTTLHVRDTGEEHLPAVLCLHSLFLDSLMFDEFTAAAAGRYRVIRPDFRGQGKSAVESVDTIDMDTCTSDVEALIEKLAIDRINLLVQSMGGDVGIRLISRRPESFASFTLIGSSARAELDEKKQILDNWVHEVSDQGFQGDVLDFTMEVMFGESTRNDPSRRHVVELWRKRIAAVPPTLAPAMRGVLERRGVQDLLPSIDIPTLIISGLEDPVRPPEWAYEVDQLLPQSSIFIVEKSGHSPLLESPAKVLPEVLKFIRSPEAYEPPST